MTTYDSASSLKRLRKIERNLKKLSNVDMRSHHYGENHLGASDFHEWIRESKNLKDTDIIRNAIYYGFQPLYDCLVDNEIKGAQRENGLLALNYIIETGIKFLTGYYTGEPDASVFSKGLTQIDGFINRLDGAPYYTKFRNVDHNGIYPKDIVLFMKQFLEHCLDGKIPCLIMS
jgi:hypothetical protein